MYKLKNMIDDICIILMVVFVVVSIVSLVWDIFNDLTSY